MGLMTYFDLVGLAAPVEFAADRPAARQPGVIARGCFGEAIRQSPDVELWMDHNKALCFARGRQFVHLVEHEAGLIVAARIPDREHARTLVKAAAADRFRGLSIGWSNNDAQYTRSRDGARMLTLARIREISIMSDNDPLFATTWVDAATDRALERLRDMNISAYEAADGGYFTDKVSNRRGMSIAAEFAGRRVSY